MIRYAKRVCGWERHLKRRSFLRAGFKIEATTVGKDHLARYVKPQAQTGRSLASALALSAPEGVKNPWLQLSGNGGAEVMHANEGHLGAGMSLDHDRCSGVAVGDGVADEI